MDFLIVSGLSGAGKSQVAKTLEDLGFYCVDNMPVELIPSFAEISSASQGRFGRIALVTDIRIGQNFDILFQSLDLISAMNCTYKIAFVEARTDVIVRRYKESRRRHPLERDGIERAVELEHELLAPVRSKADYIIDTSALSTGALRQHLIKIFLPSGAKHPMSVTVCSFGFKHGIPQEADLVFDVRFLPNPFHIPELRPLSGLDQPVRDFVMKFPQTAEFLQKLNDMLDYLLPQYFDEGKTGLFVGIGCTGGRHRSVALSEAVGAHLLQTDVVYSVSHRDVKRI